MSGSINQRPVGISSLLGIKGSGTGAPEELSGVLQPVIDLSVMYQQLGKTTVVQSFADILPIAGTSFGVSVPGTELWYVHGFTTGLVMPGAGTIKIQSYLRNPDGFTFDASEAYTMVAGEALFVPALRRDFWMMPGENLGAVVTSAVGVVANVTGVSIRIVRTILKI